MYYASRHSDQSSLMFFLISLRCTTLATKTDQTAQMHKTVRYFFRRAITVYGSWGERGKNRMIRGKVYNARLYGMKTSIQIDYLKDFNNCTISGDYR